MFRFVRVGSQQRSALLTALRVHAGFARVVRDIFHVRFWNICDYSRTTRASYLVDLAIFN